jgi:PKD repeat protein
MTIGIGAAGIGGIAFEQLSPPVLAGSPTAGGALTAGTYKYYVTALNANGETSISNEITVTTAAGNLTAALTWASVPTATGYKVYRTAAAGATGSELLLATLGVVLLYNDVAVGAPAGALPTTNTATTPGTYAAPTKFFPFNSESLAVVEDTVWRRPIRQSADIIGAVPGNFHPEGDIALESLEDVVLWFLVASRTQVVKTGSSPNFTYTITPTAAAVANKTVSITFVRNGIVFGYTGVCLSSFTFGVDNGLLTFQTSVQGRDETVQSVPVPTWPTTTPFGAGQYTIEVPTGSTVLDTDTFEFTVEDNAEAQFRLKSTGRGAQFIKYGERNSTMTMERDFESRTDYDLFKAVTAQSITITATKTVNNSIVMLAPVAIKDTYTVGLSGQGDLVRAQIAYQNIIDGTGKSWQIVIKTQEDIIP